MENSDGGWEWGWPLRAEKQGQDLEMGVGEGWDQVGLTFEDQGAEVRQAPGHLSQGGPQQPRVFVATQLQELHPQQLRGAPGTQVQQPAAAPGVQVQAQAVPGQEKGCPWTSIRIRSVCSISCSSRPGLRLLLHRSHRPQAGLGGWTCPSLPGRPAQAGTGVAAESGWGEGRSGLDPPPGQWRGDSGLLLTHQPLHPSGQAGPIPDEMGLEGGSPGPEGSKQCDLCAEEPGNLPAGRRAVGRLDKGL